MGVVWAGDLLPGLVCVCVVMTRTGVSLAASVMPDYPGYAHAIFLVRMGVYAPQ